MQLTSRSLLNGGHDRAVVATYQPGRNVTIDLIKGLAIMLVVVGHYYPPDCPAWWRILHDLIYGFHMPAFFFAAGYIWHLRPQEGYGGYLKRKVRRLLVPCVSVFVLYAPVKLAASMVTDLGHPVTAATVAKIVTDPAHSFLPFVWFLYVLFAIYAIFAAVYRYGTRMVWLSMAAAVAFYLQGGNYYVMMTSMGYLYFALGVLLAQRLHVNLDTHIAGRVMPMALTLAILFILVTLLWEPGPGWNAQPRFFLVGILGTTATVLCCQTVVMESHGNHRAYWSACWPIVLKLLAFVGSASMSICLFHTIFEGTVGAGLHRVSPLDGLPFAVKAILCIMAGILLPLLLEWTVLRRVGILRVLFLGKAGKGTETCRGRFGGHSGGVADYASGLPPLSSS